MSITKKITEAKSIVAISNFRYNEDIEKISKEYDCVIRFNKGSNPSILSKYNYHTRIPDICVLSGWSKGDFGPINAFKDQLILFSRPQYNNTNSKRMYDKIAVCPKIMKQISMITNNIEFTPTEIFQKLFKLYQYDYPTTGLITLFYIKSCLNVHIDCINFLINKTNLDNFFLNESNFVNHRHNLIIEQKILQDLSIENIYV